MKFATWLDVTSQVASDFSHGLSVIDRLTDVFFGGL